MSRHSHSDRRHSRHRGSWLTQNVALIGLAIPGAVVLVLFLLAAPGGTIVLGCAAALAALFTLACLGCLAGRFAAALYNFLRSCSARSGLEKIMHEHHARALPPQNPA